jgi:drug/metabolite transporter (DMT)-like permease
MVVFQTQPFWASILAVIFLAESIIWFEYAGMVISFGGVMFIAFYKQGGEIEDPDNTDKILLGVALSFAMAWAQSFIGLFNRMMVDVDWFVVMFWHSTIGLMSPLLVISIEAAIKGEFRLFT